MKLKLKSNVKDKKITFEKKKVLNSSVANFLFCSFALWYQSIMETTKK